MSLLGTEIRCRTGARSMRLGGDIRPVDLGFPCGRARMLIPGQGTPYGVLAWRVDIGRPGYERPVSVVGLRARNSAAMVSAAA